ncbi:MAG: hypothetical protein LLF98_14250 [Clostridium sp.]|uniref:hypothetical protein n=1 Tax=Clostridium sp. TaxID=1506 RepID=UPI0025B8CF19|nr:hypothetical protein [Clostridium sp.]MCE5222363.1 hypothetical protein [Clostridium sp.]
MKEINLKQCVKNGNKVLSGRDNGYYWRKSFKIDKLDKEDYGILVLVPEELFSINPSFFLGLFGDSIRALGEIKFRERYKFDCDEVIMESIDEDIRRAVTEIDILKD